MNATAKTAAKTIARKAPVAKTLAKRKLTRQLQVAAFCGLIQAVILSVSLSHQALGVELIATGISTVAAWAMAVSIDVGYQALELAAIFSSTEHVRKAVEKYTRPARILTLVMSAGMNSLGFTHGATAWWQFAGGIALGCFVPYMLFVLTAVGTKLYIHGAR